MSKAHKKALFLVIFTIATVLTYLRAIPQVSLTERAVVVGLGIDITEGGYKLTAQIINPQSKGQGGSEGASDGYGIVSGEGETLADAIGTIAQKTGLTVSLSQCNMIVLGDSAMKTLKFPAVNYLVQSYAVPELAIIAVTKGSAEKLFKTNPVLTTLSSFQLQQTLHSATDNSEILSTNIKDFFDGYLSKTGIAPVVYVEAKEVDKESVDKASEGGGDNYYEYDYTKVALFSPGKNALLLDPDDTNSINYMRYTLKRGGETITLDDVAYHLTISGKNFKDDAVVSDGQAVYSAGLKLKMYINEADDVTGCFSISEIPESVVERIAGEVGAKIEKKIVDTFEKCRGEGYDVYGLYDKFYSMAYSDWKNVPSDGDYLDKIRFEIKISVSIVKK